MKLAEKTNLSDLQKSVRVSLTRDSVTNTAGWLEISMGKSENLWKTPSAKCSHRKKCVLWDTDSQKVNDKVVSVRADQWIQMWATSTRSQLQNVMAQQRNMILKPSHSTGLELVEKLQDILQWCLRQRFSTVIYQLGDDWTRCQIPSVEFEVFVDCRSRCMQAILTTCIITKTLIMKVA